MSEVIEIEKQLKKLADSYGNSTLRSAQTIVPFLVSLYKNFGFINNTIGNVLDLNDINVSNSNFKGKDLFDGSVDDILSYFTGIPKDKIEKNKSLSSFSNADKAARSIKTLVTDGDHKASGTNAHNVFGYMKHILKFEEDVLNNISDQGGKIVSEAVGHLYKKKNTKECIDTVAESMGISAEDIEEVFENTFGVSVKEYHNLLKNERKIDVNEALGDWVGSSLAQLGNKLASQLSFGQNKVAANAKYNARQDAETILTAWTKITAGEKTAANAQALRSFLGSLKMDPKTVNSVLKDSGNKFLKDPLNAKNAYLPQSELRNLFLNAVNTERTKVLRNKTPTKSTTKSPAKPASTKKTAASVAPASNLAPAPSQQAPSTKAAPVAPSTVDDFVTTIKSLPANDRADAILKVLPDLSDKDIQKIITAVIKQV